MTRVAVKPPKPDPGPKSEGGKLVLMAHRDNWIMCRHPGCTPFVMMTKEWNVLPDWDRAGQASVEPGSHVIREGGTMIEPSPNDEFRDTDRLEWLMHHLPGKALREIGVVTSSGGLFWAREAIDRAMASKPLTPS